ncbi:HEAT repeat domain-containing protein [Intrasporangium sp.]|uniref:HEAT repeat domain-containing protein n=1 Tax=Intrasporangium sp. TaxID=1925024 RepID=UPI00322193A0
MTGTTLLLGASIAVVGACVGLLVAVGLVRGLRIMGERREQRLLAPLHATLIAVAAGEDDDGHGVRELSRTSGRTAAVLDQRIADLLTKVRGAPAEQLIEVLRSHGALRAAEHDLRHRSAVRRARAAQLLGLAGCDQARQGLEASLSDRVLEVRTSAAFALGLIGDPRSATPILVAVGADPGRTRGSFGLPAGVAGEALQRMGIAISDPLRTALDDPHPRTRTVAASVIGGGSFLTGLPRLRQLLADDPDVTVQARAAVAIGRFGGPDDVPALAAHTAAGAPASLRRACLAALAEIGARSALPVLTGLVCDPDQRIAEEAATALLGMGPDGVAALQPFRDLPATRSAALVSSLQRSGR